MPFLIVGIPFLAMSTWIAFEITRYARTIKDYRTRLAAGQIMSTENWDPTDRYNEIADHYDMGTSAEGFIGFTFMRRWAVRQAKGKVLEVCAGTGKNIPYYNISQVNEIHFLDRSAAMLALCSGKWERRNQPIPALFFIASVDTFPIPEEKYDTVVQTQGLCSVNDPVAELRKLQTLVKPDGKIILIEHGLGYYRWINEYVNAIWEDQAKYWGCITNRNIGKIIRESGLIVEHKSRWHFGTIWIVIGRPHENTQMLISYICLVPPLLLVHQFNFSSLNMSASSTP